MQDEGIQILVYQPECNRKLLSNKIRENLCVRVLIGAFGGVIMHTFSF